MDPLQFAYQPGVFYTELFFSPGETWTFSKAFNTMQPGLWKDKLENCLWNHLHIITGKTKELVVDFCHLLPPVNIQAMDIERVDSYKYLGVHLKTGLVS